MVEWAEKFAAEMLRLTEGRATYNDMLDWGLGCGLYRTSATLRRSRGASFATQSKMTKAPANLAAPTPHLP